METISEIIPFAKEMLNQRSSRHMLKIYVLGSTLAMLGVVARLVDTVLLPFVDEDERDDDRLAELILGKEKKEEDVKKQELTFNPTLVEPGVTDDMKTEFTEVMTRLVMTPGNRSSVNRSHS